MMISQILNQLAEGDCVKLNFDGSDVMVRFIDQSSKLSLTALVYQGDYYIPSSVRKCLLTKAPFSHPFLLTSTSVNETKFQIQLNYLGLAESLTQSNFKQLLEEFNAMAEKWRIYLDEHDKRDLLHIRVK
jgi:hypothetical protein